LNGNQIGVDHETGLFFPDFEFIAKSFGISYRKIESISEAESITFSDNQFPIIYDVMIKPDQTIYPMLVFGGDLTNLDKSVLKPVYL
jgi:thiamine pyrophosphate-dependent acetolactate synthase large subunit-like protein